MLGYRLVGTSLICFNIFALYLQTTTSMLTILTRLLLQIFFPHNYVIPRLRYGNVSATTEAD